MLKIFIWSDVVLSSIGCYNFVPSLVDGVSTYLMSGDVFVVFGGSGFITVKVQGPECG